MKEVLLTLSLALCIIFSSQAQQTPRTCAAEEVMEKQNQDPAIAKRRQLIEQRTAQFLKSKDRANLRTGILTIPVIVHVIYNTSNPQENISSAQVQSQIDVLNEDFRRLNGDVGGVPSEFSAADIEIEFTLSQVTRTASSRSSWGTNDAMKRSSQGGVDPIDPANNLNMWVCNIGGGILGYVQFPGGNPATDGVVVSPQYFGSSDKGSGFFLSAPFDKGRTTTHEVGHYLNLRHIWGDGGCSVDDFVQDTPVAGGPNYGCPNYPSRSCSNNGGFSSDQFMNYMDYVDDACMFMFSEGQKVRMDAIFAPGGPREGLGTVSGGCELPAPAGLAASGITDNGFTLTWNAVAGAISYDVNIDGNITNVPSTSYSATGLDPGTTYSTSVRARCSSSAGVFSSPLAVSTTGSNCKTAPVTLTLVLDNYPSETSWSLVKDGTTVASGSGYTTNGQTITETFDFGDGNYEFVITDSFGDGICCAYGNGSYTLEDAGSNIIGSGGAFGASESISYCISGGSGGNPAATILNQAFFETGWDGWIDGGSDAARYTGGSFSYEGIASIRLRDNSGVASSMTSAAYDLSTFDQVTIEFYFYPNSMENGEDFFVRYFDGSVWNTVTSYASGTDFANGNFYVATVSINRSEYAFPANAQFRFQCDASANADQVYIDQVTISASSVARSAGNTLTMLNAQRTLAESADAPEIEAWQVFPNPASRQLTVAVPLDEVAQVDLFIFDINGRKMREMTWQNVDGVLSQSIDISQLKEGLYFVNLRTSHGINEIKKVIITK